MQYPSLTFETKCYENDWQFLLKAGRLRQMIESCEYPFAERILYINNVENIALVKKYADKCVGKSIIDSYKVVDEFAEIALAAFNINKETFKGGYYYSIQELTGIYLCKTKYLLHFSSDSLMRLKKPWIKDAIDKMEEDNRFLVANPSWDKKFIEPKKAAIGEDDKFYFQNNGFSDQVYLIKVENFKAGIYNEPNIYDDKYPAYGGELFEKRVNAYIRNHNLTRLTSKTALYRHRNFPKMIWKRWLWINLGIRIE
jgi:hypothetical protein